MEQDDELMTAKDVAARVRVHIVTFRCWCLAGKGPPSIRVGNATRGVTRYRLSDVEKWLDEHKR